MTAPVKSPVDSLGCFDRFYEPLLQTFRDQLLAELPSDGAAHGIVDVDQIAKGAAEDFFESLRLLCTRTLVYEFHSWKAQTEPLASTGHGYYDEFSETLATSYGRAAIFEKYPVLADLVDHLRRRRVAALVEAAHRYVDDIGLLRAAGMVGPAQVRGIRCSSGDSHNGGRKVLIFDLADGQLVYKPRPLTGDEFVQAVIDLVNSDLPASRGIRLPFLLARNGYGWQEFIAHSEAADTDEVAQYFYRFGAFMAIFTCLGSRDLHLENIIAAGAVPMFIDLEMFVHRPSTEWGPPSLQELFFRRIGVTALGTMLLPTGQQNSLFDIDVSGLGGGSARESKRWRLYRIVDPGTDDYRFETTAAQAFRSTNSVSLGGRPVAPQAFVTEIQAGFHAAMTALRHRQEAIATLIRAQRWSTGTVRQVLRPTAIYSRFLEAATHPHYLGSVDERRRLFGKLTPTAALPMGVGDWALAQEVAALMVMDVPYFAADYGGTLLSANADSVLAEAYSEELSATVLAHFRAAISNPIDENVHLIGTSLLASASRSKDVAAESLSGYLAGLLDEDDPLAVACRIGDHICDSAIWLPGGTRCTWMMPQMVDSGGLALEIGNFALYETGGVLLFLAELAVATGIARYGEVAAAALPDRGRWPTADPADPDVSAFSGLGSTVYLLTRLATLLGDPSLLDLREERVRELEGIDLTRVSKLDYVGGLAGLAVVLANLPEPEEASRRVLATLAPLLSARLNELVDLPLAHGRLGVLLASARTGVALADDRLLHRVRAPLHALLDDENLYQGSTWCWGSAGVLHAAARALLDVGVARIEARDVLHRPMETLLSLPGGNRDLSLCHGSAGRLRAVLDTGRLLGDGDIGTRASRELLRVLRVAAVDGYSGGLPNTAGLLTFMLGLSGVGHALLASTGTPSALLLEYD